MAYSIVILYLNEAYFHNVQTNNLKDMGNFTKELAQSILFPVIRYIPSPQKKDL
jgi:hypothetical protein